MYVNLILKIIIRGKELRKIAAVVAALMLPTQVHALGVGGDIEWNSALNQPLDAEISLFSLGSTGQHDIKVKLAPYEAYERAGVEYPSILRELKFSVEQRQSGEFYIKLRSANAIRDPFLDILIEIDWPSGHLLREYTVLLDLPVLSDELASPVVSAPVTTPVASADSVVAMSSDGGMETAAKAVASSAAAVSGGSIYGETTSNYASGDLRYGMVKRGDTLWGIAESMRTDKSVSVHQVMMALLKNNPDAFYNNNINNLKAGYVLRLDDPAALTDMSKSAASREAQRHYQSWMAAKKGGVSGAAMTTSMPPATSVGAGAESGSSDASLKLVSPDDADLTAMPKTAGGDSQAQNFTNKDLETLRQELAYSMEASDAERQENTQLRSRIAEMEEQIGKMQRLLTLRDDALTVLQAQSQDSVPEVNGDAGAVVTSVSPDLVPVPAEEAAQDVAVVTESADSASTDMLVKPAEQPVAAPVINPVKNPVKPGPAAPASEQGVIEIALGYVNKAVAAAGSLLSPLVLGGVIGGALLLGGGFWFLRRRKISGDDLEQSMMIEVADKQLSDDMANGTVSDLSEPKDETSAVDLLDTAGSDNIEADIDEIDVLAEADVYLAYQRFDRAEELLRDAVEHEPQRYDLMLKLLEVFAASDNRDGFIEMAERCNANGGQDDAAVWAKVVSLSAGIAADHPLFGDAASVSDADDGLDSDLPGGDLDMDFGSLDDDMMSGLDDAPVDEISSTLDDLNLDTDEAAVEPASDNDGGLAFDADLGLDSDDVTTEVVTEIDDDNTLNFDMDDESLNTETVDSAPAPAETAAQSLDDGLEVDTADDNSLEFDGGLDMTATDEPVVDTATEPASDNVADDDNALSFDMDEVSLDLDSEVQDSDESELVLDEADDALSLDDGLELSVDDNGLEFDSDLLESASAELQIDDADEDENPVLLEVDTDDSAIDADLSDDIDWLTSVADDAADDDDQSDSLFSSEDEVATKLDLIRAYIDMGDKDSARNILTEVVEEGNNDQKEEAQELLRQIG